MILTDTEINKAIESGKIIITPFNPSNLGSNSYDITISNKLKIYDEYILDVKKQPRTIDIEIPENGFELKPGELYLATSNEYTETHGLVPFCEGKSSLGRFGLNIHQTAGKGDIGFCGHWTLELTTIKPIRIYPKLKIAQLIYFGAFGICANPYNKKATAKYNNNEPIPIESRFNKEF